MRRLLYFFYSGGERGHQILKRIEAFDFVPSKWIGPIYLEYSNHLQKEDGSSSIHSSLILSRIPVDHAYYARGRFRVLDDVKASDYK